MRISNLIFKELVHKKRCSIVLAAVFLCCIGYSIWQACLFNIHHDPLLVLQSCQSTAPVFFLCLIFISYEIVFDFTSCRIAESLAVVRWGKFKLYSIPVLLLLEYVGIFWIFIEIVPLSVGIAGNMPIEYFSHVLKVNLLDYAASGVLAILIGALFGLKFNRTVGYALMALLAFLMLPASDLIPGILSDGCHIDIWPLKKLFSSIFLPGQNWTIDYQYGLQIEPFRWNCVLFWCFLFSACIIPKISSHSTKIRLPVIGVCLALSLVNLLGYINSGSKIDLSEAPDSVFRTDQVYYRKEAPREEAADFRITDYDMDFVIGRDLKATVTMDITPIAPSDAYRFTLYHRYRITNVVNECGEALSFTQDGDYITISPAAEIKQIVISYEGYSPMFYSNQQGVCLPGCFPYYPWAGYKQIYYATPAQEDELVSFIPRTDLPTAYYSVHLAGAFPIYTNLGTINREESISGETNALSLMGGFLDEEESSGYDMVYCWAQSEVYHFSPDYFDILQAAITEIEQEKGYEEHIDLKEYRLFEASETMLNRCGYGLAVPFEDHIFLSAYPDIQGVAQAITYFVHEGPPLTQEEKMKTEGSIPW